jgi:hypothetical protein
VIYGPPLQKQAATPLAGVALVNGTPTILSWTAPADGLLHRVQIFAAMIIGSLETGGVVTATVTTPDGTVVSWNLFSGTQGGGFNYATSNFFPVIKAGSTVTIAQNTALTGGSATMWAEIWGS